MTLYNIVDRTTKYITGTFAVHADGAYLNGAGLSTRGENKNTSTVKKYWKGKPIPYVSAQAWRRWLRNTLIEETSWKPSTIEAIQLSEKGTSAKIAGKLNPLDYPEDDIFGYMYTSGSTTTTDDVERDLPDIQLVRKSPFRTSMLRGVSDLTALAEDNGFVHLQKGDPLPYTTEFYSSELTAVFGLDLYRLGVYENIDKGNSELDPKLIVEEKNIEVKKHPVYPKSSIIIKNDVINYQNKKAKELFLGLAKLRGGSKTAQFGTDVSPKFMILVGMNTGNILFDDLIVNDNYKPMLNLNALKEIIADYKDNFTTSIHIGVRDSYLTNQEELTKLTEVNGVKINHGTPIQIVKDFVAELS